MNDEKFIWKLRKWNNRLFIVQAQRKFYVGVQVTRNVCRFVDRQSDGSLAVCMLSMLLKGNTGSELLLQTALNYT